MGNRFASLAQYHQIVRGHGVVAAITFLFIVPFAILIARYSRSPNAMRHHAYLQILTVALSTVVLTLGWFAVGPERSLTNPHHGIGVAIYTLILVQAIGGWWNHRRKKRHPNRKPTIKMVLHWWVGRAIALLGIAQVPLGLTLYGSPKFTFVLYALWMSFLLLLFFILSYRSIDNVIIRDGSISHGGTVIEDKKPSRFGGLLGPLAAGAGAAALLGSRRNRSRSRSRREEVIPSRRGSSYVEEEKYEESHRKEGGGMFGTLLKGAAVLGAAGLAKSWWDRRQRKKDDQYDSVDPDTPSRRRRRHSDSTESIEVHRMEEGRRDRPILPGPGNLALAAAALSASEPRTNRPRTPRRRASYDSIDDSLDSRASPSRRPQSSHNLEKGVLAGLGLGWFAKKMKDRKDRKDLERLDREEAERVERERLAREGGTPSRLTGDGYPASPRRKLRRPPPSGSSNLSSVIDDPHGVRPGGIPPIPAAMAAGGLAGAALSQTRSSRQNVVDPVAMPPAPPDPQGILHEDSGSEAYNSAGGHVHRRRSSRRRREGEQAAAAAVAGAAALAAEEEARRRRSRSRGGDTREDPNSPAAAVKVNVHDRHVTLRRLTEQEAAAERQARRGDRQRRRADSTSSLSGTDTATSRRRYRRDERQGERVGESSSQPPPPAMAPLSPPNPAFAGGRRPKDSAYYSGRPGEPSGSGPVAQGSAVGSPESHGTWSGMSPIGSGSEAVDERRRRRRAERNRTNQPGGTVDFQ